VFLGFLKARDIYTRPRSMVDLGEAGGYKNTGPAVRSSSLRCFLTVYFWGWAQEPLRGSDVVLVNLRA